MVPPVRVKVNATPVPDRLQCEPQVRSDHSRGAVPWTDTPSLCATMDLGLQGVHILVTGTSIVLSSGRTDP